MKINSLQKFLLGIISGLGVFTLGVFFGAQIILTSPQSPAGELINTVLGKPNDVDFSLYWKVFSKLEEKFPDKINRQDLLYGAARGTVEALGDRYSLFLTPEETQRFFEDIKGEFGGIGAEITQDGKQYVIVAPLADSPAEKAGLKPKDVIISVDDKSAQKMGFNELINAIRGDAGTKVKLEIFREGFEDTQVFVITRDNIVVKSVQGENKNGIAYVKIITFSDDTVEEFQKIVDDLLTPDVQKLVVDVRNNPGGFLNTAIDLTSLFIDTDPVVIEERKNKIRQDFNTTLEAKYKDVPMVVLINEGSASASEIFAGAMQDRNRAKLVGMKTFGKGSVQEVDELPDGSSLRLTVARWLTPKGRQINGEGIEPDIEVQDNEKTEEDEQLEKAIEILQNN